VTVGSSSSCVDPSLELELCLDLIVLALLRDGDLNPEANPFVGRLPGPRGETGDGIGGI